jgi:hypothetical protein
VLVHVHSDGIVTVSVQLPVSIFTVGDRGRKYSLCNTQLLTILHSPSTLQNTFTSIAEEIFINKKRNVTAIYTFICVGQDNVVNIANHYGADAAGIEYPWG